MLSSPNESHALAFEVWSSRVKVWFGIRILGENWVDIFSNGIKVNVLLWTKLELPRPDTNSNSNLHLKCRCFASALECDSDDIESQFFLRRLVSIL